MTEHKVRVWANRESDVPTTRCLYISTLHAKLQIIQLDIEVTAFFFVANLIVIYGDEKEYSLH